MTFDYAVGLATISGMVVNNNLDVDGHAEFTSAQVINNLSVGTLNGYAYPYGIKLGTGMIRVTVDGSDTLGASAKYVNPFETISAALVSAVAGDEVYVLPGTYTQYSDIVVPDNVCIRGANVQGVVIQRLNATNSANLFTLGQNCRLEDLTVTMTTSSQPIAGAVYSVFNISDASSGATTKLRTLVANLNLNNPSGSGSALITTASASTKLSPAYITRSCTINVTASNLGANCYAKCVEALGQNRTSLRETMIHIDAFNCSGARIIGCETIAANSVIDLKSCTVSASGSNLTNCSLAEISQTASGSSIVLGYTTLENYSANFIGFTLNQTPANSTFGVIKTNGAAWLANDYSNQPYYLSYGTSVLSNLATVSANAVAYSPPQTCILHDITVRTNVSVGTANLYAKVYCNSIDSAGLKTTLTLSGNSIFARDDISSFKMLNTDLLFVELSGTGAVPTNFRNVYVDVGTY